jgi:hypothetical protein
VRREAERGGEGGRVRAWSRQPGLLQAAAPGALCGRRKAELQLATSSLVSFYLSGLFSFHIPVYVKDPEIWWSP